MLNLTPAITKSQLGQLCPALNTEHIDVYTPYLNSALVEFEINTTQRQCHFLGQICHESAELTRLEENLNYSAQRLLQVFPKYFKTVPEAEKVARKPREIANIVYGGRLGNDTPNSGWMYRGRTPIQLTGKNQYREAQTALGIDLVSDPDSANLPQTMFRVAGWFWNTNGLNELADADALVAITRRINGGLSGYESRVNYYERANKILSQPAEPLTEYPAEPPILSELIEPAKPPAKSKLISFFNKIKSWVT